MAVARSLIVSAFEAELQPLTCACAGAAPREHGVDVGLGRTRRAGSHTATRGSPEGNIRRPTGRFRAVAQMNQRLFLQQTDAIIMAEPELVAAEMAEVAAGGASSARCP
jgi:hopanoid C-3 methylase